MKTVQIVLKGVAPLLMNRYPIELNPGRKSTLGSDRELPSEEEYLESALHKDEIGIFLPSEWVEAALREAAKRYKVKGNKTYKEAILSAVFVEKEKIRLKDPEWIPDRRAVTVQRARIVRVRPRFDKWETQPFEIAFDDSVITEVRLLEILEEAGRSKGLGDFRPKFGRFSISAGKVLRNG